MPVSIISLGQVTVLSLTSIWWRDGAKRIPSEDFETTSAVAVSHRFLTKELL